MEEPVKGYITGQKPVKFQQYICLQFSPKQLEHSRPLAPTLTIVPSHITQLTLTGTACPSVPSAERGTKAARKASVHFPGTVCELPGASDPGHSLMHGGKKIETKQSLRDLK